MRAVVEQITPWHPTKVKLQWTVEDVTESGNFTFHVERSGSSGGPWTDLTPAGLVNTFLFEDPLNDEEANTLSLVRDIYYRIRMIAPSTCEFYSPVVNLDGLVEHTMMDEEPGNPARPIPAAQFEPDPATGITRRPRTRDARLRLIKRTMLRNMYLMLKHLNGIEYALLKRRHFGTRCEECYDPNTNESIKSGCTSCFGTTWVGGYFDPIYILARRLASQVNTNVSPQGKDDINKVRIQTLDFPHIEEGDILVERVHNQRFLVQQRYFPHVKTISTHQTLAVSELPRSAPEYKISVDLS